MKYLLIITLIVGSNSLIHGQEYFREDTFFKVEVNSNKENPRTFTLKIKNTSTSKICVFDAKYPTDVKYADTTIMNVDFTLDFLTDPDIAMNKEIDLIFLNQGESFTRKITGETKFENLNKVVIEIEFLEEGMIKEKRFKRIFRKELKTISLRKYWPMREEYVRFFFWRMDI